jgi:hypothetical protein
MTTFERIEELAESLGIEVRRVPNFPRYCLLVMPSRSTPAWCQFILRGAEPIRMMPPLLLATAEQILEGKA